MCLYIYFGSSVINWDKVFRGLNNDTPTCPSAPYNSDQVLLAINYILLLYLFR